MARHGSHKVAHHFPAHFRLAITPSIAIWGKIFVLGGVGWDGVEFPIESSRTVLRVPSEYQCPTPPHPIPPHPTPPHPTPPETKKIPHMAIEGGQDRNERKNGVQLYELWQTDCTSPQRIHARACRCEQAAKILAGSLALSDKAAPGSPIFCLTE